VYTRRIQDRVFTFDFAEGLINDNLLIVDRETRSVWSQLDGNAISGPMEGAPLTVLPSMQSTWKFWRHLYPETRVMIVESEKGRPYLYRNRKPGSPRPSQPATEHDTSALGLGFANEDHAIFFSFLELAKSPSPMQITFGTETIVIYYDEPGMTAWATDTGGRLLPTVLVYRSGWEDFFPETIIYTEEPTR
jgi:hypothetical protein